MSAFFKRDSKYLVGHQLETGYQRAAESHQTTGQATGGPGTFDLRNVDAEVLLVHLHQTFQSAGEQTNLTG